MNLQALTGEVKRLEALVALAKARAGGSGGGIPLLFDVNNAAAFAYPAPPNAPNQFAAVRNIPAGAGTTLALPATAINGQTCEFASDSSCSPGNPLVLSGNGHNVLGVASLTFNAPFAWGVAVFDAIAGAWFLETVQGTYVNTALTQAAWFINPTSGLDSNNGTTAGTPLKTWARLVQLWGSKSPVLAQNTTITFQGAGHTDNSDPVDFTPILKGGVTVQITGSLNTAVWTGTMTLVNARNRATPQLLNVTLPAGSAASQLVVNTTHPSRAVIYKASGGGNWNMSQPMLTPPPPYSFFGGPAEVNTWATADAVSGFVPTAINLVRLEPLVADENASGTNALYVSQCVGFDPLPGNFSPLYASSTVVFTDCILNRVLVVNPGISVTADFSGTGCCNCAVLGGVFADVPNTRTDYWIFFAGIVGATGTLGITGQGFALDADVILPNSNNSISVGFSILGAVFFDTGAKVNLTGILQVTGTFGGFGAFVWGPGGQINVQQTGHLAYPTGGVAVATFIQTAATPFQINGSASATSVTGAYAFATVTLTAAHLDAAAGAAGFGGNAFTLGGGSIQNLNT